MSRIVIKIILFFIYPVIIFLLLRMIFAGVYYSVIAPDSISDILSACHQGLRMDMSMAGYLTVIPAIMTIISVWNSSKILSVIAKVYFALVAIIVSIIHIVDLVLYGYWDFRIDMTPVFYFTTSPASAMASAELWMIGFGVLATAIVSVVIYKGYTFINSTVTVKSDRSIKSTIAGVLATGLLFLPIRGGVTVSTMNPSYAYFSSNMRLNHTAVNPIFSLMYSATHQSKYDMYSFMSDEEAEELLDRLNAPLDTDSIPLPLLKCQRPDIYLIILESFSTHLLPSTGGAAVAKGLDSIARSGVLFPNIYASGFRTDRAIPAILSGLPSQPSTSVLKYIDKIEHLPSLPRALAHEGYRSEYYYGGDVNFTNMNAYLVSLGFERIVSDRDFPVAEKTSKWGAHDNVLFDLALSDIGEERKDKGTHDPYFRVIQTSSSHEPYKVPYHNPAFSENERLNAFAFTDSCLTAFVNGLRAEANWDSTLVVIVPDHWGVWPENLNGMPERHRIPLVFTGGALANPATVTNRIGQQTDIAATLLAAMGIETEEDFRFSRNLLDPSLPEYAFFSRPSTIILLKPCGRVDVDCEADRIIETTTVDSTATAAQAKAYLQTLYRYLSEL